MKNFALVGNPNCGKTTLFNSLTGSTAHVGNWPGVTVDKRDGTCKLGKEPINIIDLPGIYSLSPYTPEEIITRNFIIDEKPDCVINIIDSTNLERNLYLTTQIMEMDVPVVVALNMMDVLEKNGDKISSHQLSKELGIPVVKISALKENNLQHLIDVAIEASEKKREGTTVLENSPVGHLIKDLVIAFHSLDVSDPIFHAAKLAELDELEATTHPQLVHMVKHFRDENVDDSFGNDYEAIIADSRYKYITAHYSPCLVKSNKNIKNASRSDKIDRILTNKWAGIPIFIAILFVIFGLTFSNNLFFLGGTGIFKNDCFSNISESSAWSGLRGLFYTTQGINSPGAILSNLVNALTGAFTYVVRGWLSTSPEWVSGFICDGVLGGIFAVLGFLPQILLLFLFFSILEDSGYMARVAFILDRIFKKFGLSGRAFLPMIMGFGCSVPAMINTRTIADEKEKIATLRVIPFFSCGAKLPVLTAIAGCIAYSLGFANPDIITVFMYLLGMIVAILSICLMRHSSLRGDSSPFIMELPTYHLPQFKSTMLLLWDKAKHFVKKAFTVILACTIVIWFISHFGTNENGLWVYIGENMSDSILATIGRIIQPLFIPVGFGLGKYGWVFVVAAFTGLIAKENIVATMSTLAASILAANSISIGAGSNALQTFVTEISTSGSAIYDSSFARYGIAILLAFIAFNLLTIPCTAAVASARGELDKKTFATTLSFWVVTSFAVGAAIFTIGSWWWTSFIWAVAIIALIVGVYLYDRKIKAIEKRKKVL